MPTSLTNKPKEALSHQLQQKIDSKTKPLGALGELENIALKVGLIQQTLTPALHQPHLVVFAGDHGIVEEGVSAYPSEVTRQMVLNFVNGGAAINVFCRQHGITLQIVDAGVKGNLAGLEGVISAKIANGTHNFLHQPAMSSSQCRQALAAGRSVVKDLAKTGCNVVGFGEMGIGNTSAAALWMHYFTGISLVDCIGRGTGLTPEQLERKRQVLTAAAARYPLLSTPETIMAAWGGFEMVQLVGAMLQASEQRMIVLIDGFIATAALLAAWRIEPAILDYCLFCHQSEEQGHRKALEFLGVKPLLQLSLRLGEGTGCALAYPLLVSAVHFLNEMASFESAGVSRV